MAEKLNDGDWVNKVGELEQAKKESQGSEKTIAKNDRGYKNLFDNAMVGIVISNLEGRIIQTNKAMCEISGYTYEEVLKMKAEDVYLYPEDRSKVIKKIIKYGFVKDYQVQLKNKKGKGYWASFTTKKIIHEGKEAFISSIIDINIRKNYEEGLKEIAFEELYQFGQQFFDAIVIKLYRVLNADYTFIGELTKNKKAVQTLSICIDGKIAENFTYDLSDTPCENVVGQSVCSYPKDVAKLFSKDKLLYQMGVEGYVGVPLFNKKNDPAGILVALYRTPVENISFAESFLQLVATRAAVEIERTHMEEVLRISENRFRDISLSLADWIWETDEDSKFTYISQSIKDALGYSPEELIGKTPFDLMPEDESIRIKEIVTKLISKAENIKDLENWNVHKEGRKLFMLTNGIPIIDSNGKIKGYRGINKNITSQRKLEAQLRQAQKMESIGTLAGGIAHDFNNILFPILGHTEMLLEDVPEDSPFQDSLKAICTSALRARDLVKQILTFSRQEKNELKLLKIQPIIKEALKLIRSSIPTTIEIKHDIHADCGVIKADPTQIHQIIMNLTTNAYHAMEKTGGQLKVALKEIKFSKYDVIDPDMLPGPYACITVSDTGKGIDKKLTGKIFDPFYTTKEKGKGTGMGLSVVHGIVISMNGAIKVNSQPGKGTKFNVYLPVEKTFSETQGIKPTAKTQGGTEQILLVDDEEAILTMGKKILERLGYQVTSHTSSIEALEAFRVNPDKFDLVVTDMAMPNMPGDKLAVDLVKIRSDIPILLCTGFSETMSEEKAASLGIKGFLLKPIVINDLAQKIREVLD
jgi:PAS domain S-box-containing protein